MINRIAFLVAPVITSLFVFLSGPALVWGQEDDVDFVKSIQPIFEQHCLSCHGEEDPEDFRIDEKDEAMDYIDEGSAEDSPMYLVLVTDDEDEIMPPLDEDNPLSEEQIQLVKAWIDQGAEWPDDISMNLPKPEESNEAAPEEGSHDNTSEAPAPTSDGEKEPEVDPKTQRIFNAVGSLHPAAVHMPVGLLIAAGLFALFSLRGNYIMSDCAYYCFWLGTLGAIAACVSGWWFSPMENRGDVHSWLDFWDRDQPVFMHRIGGIITTVLSLLLALYSSRVRRLDPENGLLWKLGFLVVAGGVAWVGHDGGELTHGKRHYDDLKAVGADWFPGIFGDKAEDADPGDGAEEAQEESAAPATGESESEVVPEETKGEGQVEETSDEASDESSDEVPDDGAKNET